MQPDLRSDETKAIDTAIERARLRERERRDDFRWLIEAPGPQYLAVQKLQVGCFFQWTKDHNAALAVRSKEQAEDLMMAVRSIKPEIFGFEPMLGAAQPVEHCWC